MGDEDVITIANSGTGPKACAAEVAAVEEPTGMLDVGLRGGGDQDKVIEEE